MAMEVLEQGMRIAVVSHRRDFDGISSAAEILHRYGSAVSVMLFTNPNKDEFLRTFGKLSGFRNGAVIVTDVSVSSGYTNKLKTLLQGLKARGNRLVWLDHHPMPEETVKVIKDYADEFEVGENPRSCAAELVYERLCKGDEVCGKLAKLAHITDFNLDPGNQLLDQKLRRISAVISFLDTEDEGAERMRRDLVSVVAIGSIDGEIIDRLYSAYKNSEQANMDKLNASMRSYKAGAHVIGIAFAENLPSNMACSAIKEKTGADIQVFVTTKDNAAHVRSDAGVDSSALSMALGGNGHPQASGFTLTGDFSGFDKEGMEKYANAVIAAARRVYSAKQAV